MFELRFAFDVRMQPPCLIMDAVGTCFDEDICEAFHLEL